ncbi:MAG: L-seryl-tRNA(Sec) selenium transferase [Chloroflexi bacterium]|nr:L-seryl-tRNA(Sec) selenium transferase [Chloroflexota bacterium]
MQSEFRQLPSIDKLLRDARVQDLAAVHSVGAVSNIARETVESVRRRIAAGEACPSFDELVDAVAENAALALTVSLRRVINATGVVIHTNLGRAPLSKEAVAAMSEVALGFSNLEFDLETGERGSRHEHVESLLTRVTGAEAGFAVNNNAAAVLLALMALARDKEVVLSRGQSVEIGGGFRIPDVMRQSGARLVEVGTTNKTYVADYEEAIGPNTSLLLRVHSSNFRISGFTHSVELAELVELGRRRGVAVLDDLGSGALLDTTKFGLAHEPMVQESVAAGVDLVCFSGDKLLGGPQAGLIVGKKALIERLKKYPLARALRIDKLSLAALQMTLLHYLDGDAIDKVPVWRMIQTPQEEVHRRAELWLSALDRTSLKAETIRGESTIGGGSLPGETLPTSLLAIQLDDTRAAGALAERLRTGSLAVVGRVERGKLLLDPRTVLPEDDVQLISALQEALW